MRFRNPHTIGIASLLRSDAIATDLGFLNCVDPWTHDLTIISFSKHCSNCYGHAKGENTVVHVYLNLIGQNILIKCNQYTWYRYIMYMYCSQVYNQAPKKFPALLEMLTDECDEVSWKWVYVVITAHGTCIL